MTGMEGVQLARVEPLVNPLLVYVHLFCCCACHLFWWSPVVAVVGVEVASVNLTVHIYGLLRRALRRALCSGGSWQHTAAQKVLESSDTTPVG